MKKIYNDIIFSRFCVVFLVVVLIVAALLIFPHPVDAEAKKLYPVDQAAQDPSFFKFRARLIQAVKNRDVKFIYSIIDDPTISPTADPAIKSPNEEPFFDGYNGSLKDLHDYDIEDPRSDFWEEMLKALSFGGVFQRKDKFIAPYYGYEVANNNDIGCMTAVVIGKDVPMHRYPNSMSRVISKFDYDILYIEDYFPCGFLWFLCTGWYYVGSDDSAEGFIQEKYIGRPCEHSAAFTRKGGKWRFTGFDAPRD